MTFSVLTWWHCLCAVAALNVLGWSYAALVLLRRQPGIGLDEYSLRKWQLILSGIYVLGCGFRSVLPVYDVPRICLFDTWLSTVVVGRSVATIAELSFVAQWALLLRAAANATGCSFSRKAALLVVPAIAIAECFSWYSVLTTSNIGHVFEESLWGLCAALMVMSMVKMAPRVTGAVRYLLVVWGVAGLAYVGFMFLVDVPMYWSRWLADEAGGRTYLTLAQGFLDVSGRRVVSHDWAHWKSEIAWMSLYFSVAVWFSISLVHAPLFKRAQREGAPIRDTASASV